MQPLKLAKILIDYFLPPRCLSCTDFTIAGDGFCAACWQNLSFISKPYCLTCGKNLDLSILDAYSCGNCMHSPPSYSKARSLIKFNDQSKKVIHAFKYYDKYAVATLFAKLHCSRYAEDIKDIDLIVPVPMHKLKRLLRNYNQSFILAAEFAKILAKPVLFDALVKYKWTKPQSSLKFKARQQNLIGSIKANEKYDFKDKTILLVDDVLTTGNTIKYCSDLLKYSGAKDIIVATIART